MWFFFLLTIISTLIQVLFITLAIAAGLYYMAELVEEYTTTTCRVIRHIIWICMVIQVGLWLFESFPVSLLLVNVAHQSCNLSIIRTFPHFRPASLSFVSSLLLLVLNHYWALQFFGQSHHPFGEVLAYFTLSLWLIPFAFFVSLSADENVLPMTGTGDLVSDYFRRNQSKYGLLQLMNDVRERFSGSQSKKF